MSCNNAFTEIYDSINVQMRQRRIRLCQKLWELSLPKELNKKNLHLLFSPRTEIKRRHSVNSVERTAVRVDEIMEDEVFDYPKECPLINPGLISSLYQKYVMQTVENDPIAYATFLRFLRQTYDIMCNSSMSLEKFCSKIFKQCYPGYNVTSCNIHKSIFLSKILEYKIIKVIQLSLIDRYRKSKTSNK